MEKKKKKEYPLFTRELVVESLRELGLGRGDVVFMHSSLKDLAPAAQLVKLPDMGMPYVIDALKEVVGPQGLIVLPTFSFCFAKSSLGPTGTIWDKKTSRSRVGAITNYFLKQRGVQRSDHPTHSVAALGTRSEEFVKGHVWSDGSTFHRGGPWGRLCDWDGYVLFLGTYLNTCTLAHAVEDWMRLPYLVDAECVILDDNRDVKVVPVAGSPSGCRDFYNKRDTKLEKRFAGVDFSKDGKICMADVTLFKARELVRHLWQWLKEDPWLLLHKDSKDEFCWQAGQATEKHLANFNEPCPW